MSHRLFVGIDLPDSIRASLHIIQSGLKDARWVPPENLHLTLRFVGEVDRAQADDIDHALMTVRATPIDIELRDAGAFGSGNRARILWAGVTQTAALKEVKALVDSALGHAGLGPDDRKYAPHITLARFTNGPARVINRRAAEMASSVCGCFTANELTLFESFLGPGGAHYERMATYPLRAP